MKIKHFSSSFLLLGALPLLLLPGYSNQDDSSISDPVIYIEYNLETRASKKVTASSLGYTPLMTAIWEGDAAKAKSLIATEKNLDAKNSEGKTALMIASDRGEPELITLLAKTGADLNAVDEGGLSALMLAAFNANTESMKALIQAGADVNIATEQGMTALIALTQSYDESPESVECIHLLAKAGASMNVEDKEEGTPLACAAAAGHLHRMAALIKEGAEVNRADSTGTTALHVAVLCCNEKCVRWLLSHGADLEARDIDGETPLFVLVSSGKAKFLDQQVIETERPKEEENDGASDMFKEGEIAMTRLLLSLGAKADIKNAKGEAMIEAARGRAYPETVRLLQEAVAPAPSEEE